MTTRSHEYIARWKMIAQAPTKLWYASAVVKTSLRMDLKCAVGLEMKGFGPVI